MEPRLQRRVQRYGWDKAAGDYEAGWRAQLEPAQTLMLAMARLQPGEHALDVACGTGLVSVRIGEAVGADGAVVGTDISGEMVAAARRLAAKRGIGNAMFERSDAEALPVEDGRFDVALCALGLMYVPDPVRALGEMQRALKPGGRVAAAVWGARAQCGWAEVFPITDARVASEVCPMFFHLGTGDVLAQAFADAGLRQRRRGAGRGLPRRPGGARLRPLRRRDEGRRTWRVPGLDRRLQGRCGLSHPRHLRRRRWHQAGGLNGVPDRLLSRRGRRNSGPRARRRAAGGPASRPRQGADRSE